MDNTLNHANMYDHVETTLTKLVKRTISQLSLTIHILSKRLLNEDPMKHLMRHGHSSKQTYLFYNGQLNKAM